jgi:hypothetical protein
MLSTQCLPSEMLTAQSVKKHKMMWTKIGEVNASFKLENESILAAGNERFSSIRLQVSGKDLNLQNIEIYYESGEMDEIAVKKLISANTATDDFPLRANKLLKKVVFSYKSPKAEELEAATVELFGLK